MEGQIHIVHDRLKGVLLGMAAGERNGGPISMALELADSLIELNRFDADDIFRRYLEWWHSEGVDTGPIAADVFTSVSSGVMRNLAVKYAHISSGNNSAGCNPAHRSLPLSIASCIDDSELLVTARQEAILTHEDPRAGDVAAATVMLCRKLVRGESWLNSLEKALSGRMSQTVHALFVDSERNLSRSGFAPHALQAAVYFTGSHNTFSDALEASLAFAGPDNYCPVLVGAIGGARWGASEINSRHLEHCDKLARVIDTADQLAQMWK